MVFMSTAPTSAQSKETAKKREQVSAACSECRLHKVKCDGTRPICGRCQSREVSCLYDVEAGVTRAITLKRKIESLENQNQQMQELFGHIRTRAPQAVAEIVKRIRTSTDVSEVLRFVQEGDLVLQQQVHIQLSGPETSRIDADALRESRLKLPAQPWTSVAGDGIVSDLVSTFLDTEQPYFCPMLDPQAFISDMTAADVATARYCSPLLVNVMCAVGAFTSPYALAVEYPDESKLSALFFDEAKEHLDREKGKTSVPTTQALYFMYMYCIGAAEDRLALMYRSASCEMYKRMKSGVKILRDLPNDRKLNHRKLLSRHAWGLFYFETLVSTSYLQPPLLDIPSVPYDFVVADDHDHYNGGTKMTQLSSSMPLECGTIVDAQYRGSIVFAKIALSRAKDGEEPGSIQDVAARIALYYELREWARRLPPKACYPLDDVSKYNFLNATYHLHALLIFRPLSGIVPNLPEPVNDPERFCITSCIQILEELESWGSVRPRDVERGSLVTMWFYFLCSFTLLPLLKSHETSRQPFVSGCVKIQKFARYWPAAVILLSGIQAVSHQLDIELPRESLYCFREIEKKLSVVTNGDIPITWALPENLDLLELLSDDGTEPQQSTVELGAVIAKWNKMSLTD